VRRGGLGVEDVALEVVPERGVGDREVADLLALGEDRQALADVVEVLELDGLQRALAQPVVEEEPEGDAVAQVVLAGDDRAALVGGERRAVTSRARARSIASVGSPCMRPRSRWNLKKSRTIERFLL
jgi:hypothetical protein